MSTILKALQHLEDEKSANVERPLDEQIVAHQRPPDRDRRGLRIGAVAVSGLAVVAAAFLFWPTREDSDAEVAMESRPLEAAPVAANTQDVAAEKPRRRLSARPVPAARAQQDSPEAEVASIVEVVKRLDAQLADSAAPAAASKRAAPIANADAARPARRLSARKPDTQVAGGATPPQPARKQVADAKPPATQILENSAPAKPALALPAAVEMAAVAPKPAPALPAAVEMAAVAPKPAPALPAAVEMAAVVPKPAPALPAAVEMAAVAPKPAPALLAAVEMAAVAPKPAPTAAPASTRASIREPARKVVQRAKLPLLSIEKTIWHPDGDRRVVIVKLIDAEEVLRLKEGDAVGPLVVQVIKPGSVLFNHDGIEIQYNVGG